MAAGYRELDLEGQQTDTYPLLMDHASALSIEDHIVNITPGSPPEGQDGRGGLFQGSDPTTLPSTNAESDVAISVGPQTSNLSTPVPSQPQLTPANGSLRRSGSTGRHGDANNYRQRTSPLNSGLWISIELAITVSQIIASIIVLSLSRDEKPKAPLSVWVVGYATGCLATLPLLYWRYTHRYAHQPDQDSLASPAVSVSTSSPPSSPHTSHSLPEPTTSQGGEREGGLPSFRGNRLSNGGDLRMAVHVERFKIALDCFFAVWFVVGNVWIFGGHSSSREAPNLYRLCIVFLTFSCIGYAMPFILCATICCCLPCIITLLGFREDQGQAKGAAPEVIEALPIYKFKAKGGKGSKDGNDSDCEGPGEGGVFAAGTPKERAVSAEDAVCCICLGKYKDDVELRELPCTHFFHVECVDKWLKINASCPLCKHEVVGSGDQLEQPMADAGEQTDRRVHEGV